jgi:hypothetical protein
MPSRTLDKIDINTRIVPVQKAFSLFHTPIKPPAHPRIQAKRQQGPGLLE